MGSLFGGKDGKIICDVCDRKDEGPKRPEAIDRETKREAQSIFTKLINLPSFKDSRRPRVVAMIALRRIINHTDEAELFDLETSPLGQWCLQGLHSSIREIRIASGYASLSYPSCMANFVRQTGFGSLLEETSL